jgi:diacylglycerol kinase
MSGIMTNIRFGIDCRNDSYLEMAVVVVVVVVVFGSTPTTDVVMVVLVMLVLVVDAVTAWEDVVDSFVPAISNIELVRSLEYRKN